MRELTLRILRRSIVIAIVLGLMGYGFAEILLMMIRMNGVPDPANEAVRWRAPVTMVSIGVGMLVVLELILYAVRRKKVEAPTLDDAPADPLARLKKPEPPR